MKNYYSSKGNFRKGISYTHSVKSNQQSWLILIFYQRQDIVCYMGIIWSIIWKNNDTFLTFYENIAWIIINTMLPTNTVHFESNLGVYNCASCHSAFCRWGFGTKSAKDRQHCFLPHHFSLVQLLARTTHVVLTLWQADILFLSLLSGVAPHNIIILYWHTRKGLNSYR